MNIKEKDCLFTILCHVFDECSVHAFEMMKNFLIPFHISL